MSHLYWHRGIVAVLLIAVFMYLVFEWKQSSQKARCSYWAKGRVRNLSMKMRHLHKEFSVAIDHYFLAPVY